MFRSIRRLGALYREAPWDSIYIYGVWACGCGLMLQIYIRALGVEMWGHTCLYICLGHLWLVGNINPPTKYIHVYIYLVL